MLLILIFLLRIYDHLAKAEEIKGCTYPSGKRGYCVRPSKCTHGQKIQEQIKRPALVSVTEAFSATFICEHGDYVCCLCSDVSVYRDIVPYDSCGCTDANTCVPYNECPEFLSLIRLFASTRHLVNGAWYLVINSWRCDDHTVGNDAFRVCCPSKYEQSYDDRYDQPKTFSSMLQRTPSLRILNHPNRHILAPKSKCGRSRTPSIKSRIVGGRDALLGQFPAIANIGYERRHPKYGALLGIVYECGGVLIGERYVLTAAHCIEGIPKGRRGPVTVRLGEYDLTKARDCSGGICAPEAQNFGVEEVVTHPNYTGHPNLLNDIALIRLDKSYIENGFVNAICLPFEDNFERTYMGKTERPFIFVAGWGATDRRGRKFPKVLQYLELDIFPFDKCKDIYQSYGSNLSEGNTQLCAGGDMGRDSCGGDSGSSLMLEDRSTGTWTTIGVVSFGPRRCGQKGVPAIYTKVDQFLNWILDNIYE
ncbi:CLIP domain-containing serine protease B4 isoform X1 [Lepeophtheirus salmonis]|uniref:CLIP domain-containing serine protease B4 isoform X1 n=1 Tax=Lepeophtheirus salmonis TaxID=72036 RepID=UPI001AE8E5D8|nr:CLIP domain-containing serine protease 14D-like isoform X1 [Lepeophtheirus salmonis]